MAKRRMSKYQRHALTQREAARRGEEPQGFAHLANGGARSEFKRGASWWVRDVPAARALKVYLCPLCGLDVPVGQAHIVAWRQDWILGDSNAIEGRRHYHAHCWRLP